MMDLRLRAEMLGRTEEEIRSEMASALGRIGLAFQGLLAQLSELDPAVEHSSDPDIRRKYSELLEETRQYYWYLIVQRESIGLRNHEDVIREYRVPPVVLRRR